MDGVPCDDDITYTLLGLLILLDTLQPYAQLLQFAVDFEKRQK